MWYIFGKKKKENNANYQVVRYMHKEVYKFKTSEDQTELPDKTKFRTKIG